MLSVVLLLLTGCSSLRGTGDVEYIQADGNVLQIDPDDREDPVDVAGSSLEGEPLDLADSRGQVTVVNVWASWCGPCRAETPDLIAAAGEADATFMGIHIRESVENGLAFERNHAVPYPSLHDEGGETLLEFGRYTPRNPPTTLVLDRDGRVAALVSGALPSKTTLTELVEEIAAEDG